MPAFLKIPYQECGETVEVNENWGGSKKCVCESILDTEQLQEALDTDPIKTDNYFDSTLINCVVCQECDSVTRHHSYFICTNCISVFLKWGICGWCNEGQVGGGDLADSYCSGCEFCEGRIGWDKDD